MFAKLYLEYSKPCSLTFIIVLKYCITELFLEYYKFCAVMQILAQLWCLRDKWIVHRNISTSISPQSAPN